MLGDETAASYNEPEAIWNHRAVAQRDRLDSREWRLKREIRLESDMDELGRWRDWQPG